MEAVIALSIISSSYSIPTKPVVSSIRDSILRLLAIIIITLLFTIAYNHFFLSGGDGKGTLLISCATNILTRR